MADKGNDPAVIWQTMIGEMEKGFNSFGNQLMSSPEFSKVMNQAGGVAAGAQKQLGELMEKYLLAMNLPSRAQLVGMAERCSRWRTSSTRSRHCCSRCITIRWRRTMDMARRRGRRARSARHRRETANECAHPV